MLAVVTQWWWMLLLLFVVGIVVGSLAVTWRPTSGSKPSDIDSGALDANLQWDTAPDDALKTIYSYVVAGSDSTIQWYRTRRRPKRRLGFALRLGALILTLAAGLVPLSSIPPVWSTVMLAFAGGFVSVDVMAGHTSGWVRYMLAEQKVERLRDAFLLEWHALKVAKIDVPSTLERAKAFLLAVGKIVDEETHEWAADFQNALKEMERARKAAAEIERAGAIEVTMKNPKAVTEWILEIDGSQRGRTSGKSLAVTDVAVGVRKLKAYGDDPQGKRLSDEKTVKVEGGGTATKELELS